MTWYNSAHLLSHAHNMAVPSNMKTGGVLVFVCTLIFLAEASSSDHLIYRSASLKERGILDFLEKALFHISGVDPEISYNVVSNNSMTETETSERLRHKLLDDRAHDKSRASSWMGSIHGQSNDCKVSENSRLLTSQDCPLSYNCVTILSWLLPQTLSKVSSTCQLISSCQNEGSFSGTRMVFMWDATIFAKFWTFRKT